MVFMLIDVKILMIVLLEYINLLQFHKQSTPNIWKSLRPARPILGYATLLNDINIIIEILYEVYLNSCKQWKNLQYYCILCVGKFDLLCPPCRIDGCLLLRL